MGVPAARARGEHGDSATRNARTGKKRRFESSALIFIPAGIYPALLSDGADNSLVSTTRPHRRSSTPLPQPKELLRKTKSGGEGGIRIRLLYGAKGVLWRDLGF